MYFIFEKKKKMDRFIPCLSSDPEDSIVSVPFKPGYNFFFKSIDKTRFKKLYVGVIFCLNFYHVCLIYLINSFART